MNDLLHAYVTLIIATALFVSLVFLISRSIDKRNDLADVAWGKGFVLIALTSYLLGRSDHIVSPAGKLASILITIWGVRLAIHIFRRFLKTSGDRRYAEAVRRWRKYVELRSYLSFFLFQGFLMLLISVPVVIANTYSVRFHWYQFIGLVVWLIGFGCETVGDAQLSKFVQNPNNKGKLMTQGLWRYSRHPNYFGELTQWWAISFIVLPLPYGWLGLIGPGVLSYLIIKVSGIPTAEAHLKQKPDWADYARRTNVLIPGRPR